MIPEEKFYILSPGNPRAGILRPRMRIKVVEDPQNLIGDIEVMHEMGARFVMEVLPDERT